MSKQALKQKREDQKELRKLQEDERLEQQQQEEETERSVFEGRPTQLRGAVSSRWWIAPWCPRAYKGVTLNMLPTGYNRQRRMRSKRKKRPRSRRSTMLSSPCLCSRMQALKLMRSSKR